MNKSFQKWWASDAQFCYPCNTEEFNHKEWEEFYWEIYKKGWEDRKVAEYHTLFSDGGNQ